MIKRTFLFAILLFATFSVISQTEKATLDVVVMNRSNERIPNDKITFMGQESGIEVVGITDENGEFVVQLPAGDDYAIKVETIGEEIDYNTFSVPTPPPGSVFKPVTLQIIYELPTVVVLEDLNFTSGSFVIKKSSFESLDNLAEYLIRKKTTKISVEGYTDSDGDEAGNKTLSSNRSKAVKRYLVAKGVKTALISTVGHGENDPIASNDTAEGKAQNRRTEIHIVD